MKSQLHFLLLKNWTHRLVKKLHIVEIPWVSYLCWFSLKQNVWWVKQKRERADCKIHKLITIKYLKLITLMIYLINWKKEENPQRKLFLEISDFWAIMTNGMLATNGQIQQLFTHSMFRVCKNIFLKGRQRKKIPQVREMEKSRQPRVAKRIESTLRTSPKWM